MSITLLAFGRRGYAIATANMVLSLRHHGYCDRINLHCTEGMELMLDEQTKAEVVLHRLSNELASDPGLCKVSLPSIIADPTTLYLDVDGIAMKDVTPLIDQLSQDERHRDHASGTGLRRWRHRQAEGTLVGCAQDHDRTARSEGRRPDLRGEHQRGVDAKGRCARPFAGRTTEGPRQVPAP
jgi:hypothetical protein